MPLVLVHPEVKNWIKYAKFEEKNGYINSSRSIYERAVEFFGEDNISEQMLIAFAKFEEGQREVIDILSLNSINQFEDSFLNSFWVSKLLWHKWEINHQIRLKSKFFVCVLYQNFSLHYFIKFLDKKSTYVPAKH